MVPTGKGPANPTWRHTTVPGGATARFCAVHAREPMNPSWPPTTPAPAEPPLAEEYFDVVDEHDVVLGRRPRSEVHALGLRHRAVHVILMNTRGEVFLQQRSLRKDCSPGVWDSSSSGHVDSGEDYDDAVYREVAEELGVRLEGGVRRWFKIPAGPETEQEFCWVYRVSHEGPFQLQASELRGGGWFCPEAIDAWLERRPGDFASSFRVLWRTVRLGDGRGESG